MTSTIHKTEILHDICFHIHIKGHILQSGFWKFYSSFKAKYVPNSKHSKICHHGYIESLDKPVFLHSTVPGALDISSKSCSIQILFW